MAVLAVNHPVLPLIPGDELCPVHIKRKALRKKRGVLRRLWEKFA